MKALVGAWDNRPYPLLAEITALRTRVAELERALARAEQENAALRESLRERSGDAIEVTTEAEIALSATP